MPRPPDNYTHAQFESVDSDFLGETVRCVHCKTWNGSVKTLNRKKEHLLKCTAYAAWREAGNGQDLAPPNKYSKRDSSDLLEDSPYGNVNYGGESQFTPSMARRPFSGLDRAFDEFWDDNADAKCMRARCKYCGAARAKNTTRQYEHLQQCTEFQNSTEGQEAVAHGLLQMTPAEAPMGASTGRRDIWRGAAPNPNLMMARPKPRPSASRLNPAPTRSVPQQPKPSLANHLLSKHRATIEEATQLRFLSHAGGGTLSTVTLEQWLTQQGHMSRALVPFIGSLTGKIRLSDTKDPQKDTTWRALDLLVSTLSNATKELEFLRTTMLKYGLRSDGELPKHATKGLMDILSSASSPAASLLEGMVLLWSIEHLYCISWQYASTFVQPGGPSSTSYSLPSYLQTNDYNISSNYAMPQGNGTTDAAHVAALHKALIPNWTSQGFSKFVEACKAIVDELANAQTSGNGASELNNCELVFTQVVWLWKQVWPKIKGMSEEDDDDDESTADADGHSQANGNKERTNRPIEIPDEEEHEDDAPSADSPYGGTGLGAVAAANRTG